MIRDWLPQMLDRVDPWMSDTDIQAGTRALQVIEDRLNNSEFGIIVVTTENQHSTWLNFEAGALSKRFEGRTSRVVPVLVNFDSFYQIEGPIRQFQGIMLTRKPETEEAGAERAVDKESVRELLKAVSDVAGTNWPMVETRFEWSWPDFESAITEAMKLAGVQPPAPEVTDTALLKELLDKVDGLERHVRAPRPRFTRPQEPVADPVADSTPKELFAQQSARARTHVEATLKHYGIEYTGLVFVRTGDGGVRAKVSLPAVEMSHEYVTKLGAVENDLAELGIGVKFATQ